MPDIPSRETLTTLTQAVDVVRPSSIIGFSRHLEDGQIQMLYSYRFGIGAFVAPIADVPEALRPFSRGIGRHEGFFPTSLKAIDWHLAFAGARQLVSVSIPDQAPETRFWVGLADVRQP